MDASNVKSHIALYGDVAIERRYCTDCKRFAFVIDGEIRCCGAEVEQVPTKRRKRMCDVSAKRNGPSRKEQKRLLNEQDWSCFWCGRKFGKSVWRGRVRTVLRVEWDHVVPFAYSQNNQDSNFVASCQVCNRIKSSLMLDTVDEYRVHIRNRWSEKGYSDVRPMQGEVRPETPTSEVL